MVATRDQLDFGRISKIPKPNHAAPSTFTPRDGSSSNSHGNGNFNPLQRNAPKAKPPLDALVAGSRILTLLRPSDGCRQALTDV